MIPVSSPNSDKSDPWTSHIYFLIWFHPYLEVLGVPFLYQIERQQRQIAGEPTISFIANEAALEDVA